MEIMWNESFIVENNGEWIDQVIRNPDGTVMSPTVVEIYFTVGYGLCCLLFGLPLNVHTAKRVARERNNFDNSSDEAFNNLLLARVFSALFTLFAMFIEMICGLSEDGADDDGGDFCHLNVLLTGLPYLLFLLNLFFSLVECYTKVKWFQPHVIAVLNLLLALVVNWIYVTGLAPLRCAYQKVQLVTLAALLFILFFSCVVLKILVHKKRSKTAQTRQSIAHHPVTNNKSTASRRKRQREMKKTFILTGVTLNLFLPIPLIVLFLSHLICLPYGQQCSHFLWLAAYFYKFAQLHVFIDALIYLHVSSDSSGSNLLRNDDFFL